MPVHPFIKLTILFNSRLKRSRIIQNPCRHPLAYSLRAYGVPIMYFIETINPDATTDSKLFGNQPILHHHQAFTTKHNYHQRPNRNNSRDMDWIGKHANTISDTRHPPIPARCLQFPAIFNNISNTVTNNTDPHTPYSTAICRYSLKAKSGVPATHASESEYLQSVKYLSWTSP